MKKIFILLLFSILVLISAFFVGCANTEALKCYVPDGAPALAVANVIGSGRIGNSDVAVIVTTGEDVVSKCASGEADLAILPTNAAVTVCSKRDDYCIFSVNVYGLLYVVGTQQISALTELQGKTVYSIGLGNTPEYVFKKVLDASNVSYNGSNGINFEYVTDGSTVIPLILQGKAEFAVLGEPAVTNLIAKAQAQNKTVYRLFDLQQLWQQATNSDSVGYPQASLIVKKALLSKNNFAEALQQTVFANSAYLSENTSTLKDLLKGAGSSYDIDYTMEIVQSCNLTAVLASNAKQDIETYLQTFSAMQQYLPLADGIIYETTH